MPTTSPETAQRALQGLTEADVKFVLLHGATKLLAENISDVDIAVAIDPVSVIRAARLAWDRRGLFPILMWPYDIGGALTLFLASQDGTEGVQLDMLFDPAGQGKYGLRSKGLVESAVTGPVPVVDDPARLVYLWRKRVVKGDDDALAALRSEATAVPEEDLLRTSKDLTGSTETAKALLADTEPRSVRGRAHPLARVRRVAGRLANPIGYWAHVTDQAIAVELAERLSGYLVVVRIGATPRIPGQLTWYVRHVWPTTIRPGIYMSHGTEPSWCPSPTVVLTGRTADEAAPLLIAAMRARLPA